MDTLKNNPQSQLRSELCSGSGRLGDGFDVASMTFGLNKPAVSVKELTSVVSRGVV